MSTGTRKAGRPAYVPSDKERAQVKMLSAMGVRDSDIAKVIAVSRPTLRKHFGAELEIGHIEAGAKVAATLFKAATDIGHPRCVLAAMFWLKCREGWRETAPLEPPGKPAPVKVVTKVVDASIPDPQGEAAHADPD